MQFWFTLRISCNCNDPHNGKCLEPRRELWPRLPINSRAQHPGHRYQLILRILRQMALKVTAMTSLCPEPCRPARGQDVTSRRLT